MSTILLPPMFLAIAPIVLAGVVGERALPPELAAQVLAQRPEWASFTPRELAGAFAVQQFLVFFLLMPAYIPLSIATFSIIGEKQARTLEPVLATPIRTVELLAGKVDRRARARASWPAGSRTSCSSLLASVVYGPELFGVVTDASWLAGRVRARTGRRAVVGRGRRHRQRAGQRSAGRPADRRHHHRADHRGDTRSRRRARSSSGRPGTCCWPRSSCVVSLIGLRIGVRAVRPGGDPDPLALDGRRAVPVASEVRDAWPSTLDFGLAVIRRDIRVAGPASDATVRARTGSGWHDTTVHGRTLWPIP